MKASPTGTTVIVKLDHMQLAFPDGPEDAMRAFYCGLLGLTEIPKPAPLQGRGGFWVQCGDIEIHFGRDPDFHAASKAHPAFVVADIAALAKTLSTQGHEVKFDTMLPDVTRFFTHDPAGNRVECIAA